jgi:putative membrane protein
MLHIKSPLATLSAIAAILGATGCSNSVSTPPNSPRAPIYSSYGPALGAGAGYTAGPSTMATPGSVGKPPPPPLTGAQMTQYVPPTSPSAPVTASAIATTSGTVTRASAPVTWGSGPAAEDIGVTNPMGGMDVSNLTDAQTAAVIGALNEGEIEQAQLAMTKATSPEVKRFAGSMATAHRQMQNKATELLKRLQITPMDNAVSSQLKSDTQSEMTTLQSLRGKEFDRDYIDAQVRAHNEALELLDRMTPNVKNPELKSAINADRPKIESHLREAERVQQTLQKGNANSQP